MKISKLIEKLRELKKQHGDIDVAVHARDDYCCDTGEDFHECLREGVNDINFDIEVCQLDYMKPDSVKIVQLMGYLY